MKLIKDVKEICRRGGFNLHKFTSNGKEVIHSTPIEQRAEDIKSMKFDREALPIECALGVHWCIESDTFTFSILLKE